MQAERIMARYAYANFRFMQDALAAAQADVQLNAAEVASGATNAVAGITMPYPGWIVDIAADTSAAATTGSMTVGPTIGGTEKTDPTLSITTETTKYDRAPRGTTAFVAGDILGAEITTSADWDGTSADLVVTVGVVFDLQGI